ncbi:hypothetical protein H6G96_21300 [Nostoc sp. FACHB-892]|uniref:hypothetical protein n=1 Tax=Nostoc sp. FACHB-892 TaxID=2692843 RepID=UPI00168A06B3|nr:hypothetical protein [Nostoc sp. FACHB-892]MBD2728789.1 hypothetical protein [Nostoc sp. FACHB-892]
MRSTLLTELTVSEEANLSGGKKIFKKNKSFNQQSANGGIAISGFNFIIGSNNTINSGNANANGGSNSAT